MGKWYTGYTSSTDTIYYITSTKARKSTPRWFSTAALEVREAMGSMALDNIFAFAKGEPLPNPV